MKVCRSVLLFLKKFASLWRILCNAARFATCASSFTSSLEEMYEDSLLYVFVVHSNINE